MFVPSSFLKLRSRFGSIIVTSLHFFIFLLFVLFLDNFDFLWFLPLLFLLYFIGALLFFLFPFPYSLLLELLLLFCNIHFLFHLHQ